MKPWLGPLAIAVVCGIGVVATSLRSRPAEPRRGAASEQAIALLGGLREGQRVAGWTVLGIEGPREETIRIDYGRDDLRFAIMVSPLGTVPDSPPMHSDLYAIYYGHVHPEGATIPAAATRALLADTARRVRKTEHDVVVGP